MRLLFILFFYLSVNTAFAKTVKYDLNIDYQRLEFQDKQTLAMTVNGGIPAPTLYFNKGDIAQINVTNNMDVDTSVHWHGILLPNYQDGVPYINHPPIKPKNTHLFQFELKHAGTYWYHSHTGLQEQRGVYGAIVITETQESDKTVDVEKVVVLSDWTYQDPNEIFRSLKSGSEYFAIQKGSNQNLWDAFKNKGLTHYFKQSWQRMAGMDISDIAYDLFLANGQPEIKIPAKVGDKVKLRFVNAGTASYFNLQFSGGNMQLIAADGMDVQAIEVKSFLMAIAETYDVIVTVPKEGLFELKATAQDGTGHTSIWIGNGTEKIYAPILPKPNPYQMAMPISKTAGHHEHHAMHKMAKNQNITTPYARLKATHSTKLLKNQPVREIKLNLTGDMKRYVWSLNNEILAPENTIKIKRGEKVRFILKNKTMMHHPMHLHGHFFRVLNGQGDYAPLKHTIDVPPMGERVIEFDANEHYDWFFHCHILYHAKSGMARIVSYEEPEINKEISPIRHNAYQDNGFLYAEGVFLSQMTEGNAFFSTSKNSLHGYWKVGWQNVPEVEYDIELNYQRYINRYLNLFAGVNFINEEVRGIFGFNYLLPFNIENQWRTDTDAQLRVKLGKTIQLTNRLGIFAEFEYDTETKEEWQAGLRYRWLKNLAVVTQYHSDFGVGAGVQFIY